MGFSRRALPAVAVWATKTTAATCSPAQTGFQRTADVVVEGDLADTNAQVRALIDDRDARVLATIGVVGDQPLVLCREASIAAAAGHQDRAAVAA